MRRKRRLINVVPRLSKAIEHQLNRQQPGRRMGSLATPDLAAVNTLTNNDRNDVERSATATDTSAIGGLALIPLVAVLMMVLFVMALLKIRALRRERKQIARLQYVYDLLEKPASEVDSIAVMLAEGDKSPFFQPAHRYKALALDVRRVSTTSEIFMHFSRLDNRL